MRDQNQTVVSISIADAAQVYGGMMKLPEGPRVTAPVSDATYWYHGTISSSSNGVGIVIHFD
jgi:hypothetical protein